ncbi:uncharacterized protein LOC141638867 [Silene latifolia]|uniref:uncharacterized protein LOC141638867 n=1 Tax=Silene latifolia TaxID=37657 RepID=UPI003D774938
MPNNLRDHLFRGTITPKILRQDPNVDGSVPVSKYDPMTINGSFFRWSEEGSSYNKEKVVYFQPKSTDAGMRDLEERAKLLLSAPYPERLVPTKEQVLFNKFENVIRSLNVQVPFLELVNQVPAYMKFMKKLLSKKKSLETVHSVALTEESCSYLTHTAPHKLEDPGNFSVPCSIGTFSIEKALCHLGDSISVMPLSLARTLKLTRFAVINMTVQMVDRSAVQPIGVLEDIHVQIGKFFFPVDFVVLDMPEDAHIPIILGRPFLHTAGAVIDVSSGTLTFKVGKHSIVFAQTAKKKDPMWPVTCNTVSEKKSYFVLPDMPVSMPVSAITPPPQIGSKLEDDSSGLDIAGAGLGKEEPHVAPAVK